MLSLLSLYYLWLSILLLLLLLTVVTAGFIMSAKYLKRDGSDITIPLGAILIVMILVWAGWVFLI